MLTLALVPLGEGRPEERATFGTLNAAGQWPLPDGRGGRRQQGAVAGAAGFRLPHRRVACLECLAPAVGGAERPPGARMDLRPPPVVHWRRLPLAEYRDLLRWRVRGSQIYADGGLRAGALPVRWRTCRRGGPREGSGFRHRGLRGHGARARRHTAGVGDTNLHRIWQELDGCAPRPRGRAAEASRGALGLRSERSRRGTSGRCNGVCR